MAPPFSVNAERRDPYKTYKFRLRLPDGAYLAGLSKMSALKRSTEVVKFREGGDPSTSRKSPGQTEYEAVTLERGVTHDTTFEQWANKVWNFGSGLGAEVSLKDFRKDLVLEIYNEAGQLALARRPRAVVARRRRLAPRCGRSAARRGARPGAVRPARRAVRAADGGRAGLHP